MDDFSNAYAQKLKRHAFLNGLPLMGLSTHQDFVDPDKYVRRRNVEQTIFYVQQAHSMGIPTIRINTGRWGTSKNFDELMKNKGIEPRLEGFTDDDGYKWVIDSIEKLVPAAEKYGVILGLENHWGLGLTAGRASCAWSMRSILPWLQVTLDTGNFLEECRRPDRKQLAPQDGAATGQDLLRRRALVHARHRLRQRLLKTLRESQFQGLDLARVRGQRRARAVAARRASNCCASTSKNSAPLVTACA